MSPVCMFLACKTIDRENIEQLQTESGFHPQPVLQHFVHSINKIMEQREFQRFPLRCRLQIQGKNQSGHPFVETTELINISGGGALFSTRRRDYYVKDQTVEANILLPGTPEMQGSMTTSARVVSVNDRKGTPAREQAGVLQVAIHFLEPLRLLRQNRQKSPVTQPQGI